MLYLIIIRYYIICIFEKQKSYWDMMNLSNLNFKNLLEHFKMPVYKNSFFLLITSLINTGSGFVFWIIAARLYDTEYVGLATALISAMSLISVLSILGFDQSIVRYFPNRNKSNVFYTSLIITAIITTILGIIFISGINIWTPQLNIIYNFPLIFMLVLIANSIINLTSMSFIALRKSEFYFFQNLLMLLRIIFLFLLVFLGAFGIFSSLGLSMVIALIFSLIFLTKFGIRPVGIDKEYLIDSFHFSTGNYFVMILGLIPNYILPIIVLNVLGPNNAAYYYISFVIGSIMSSIPYAFSLSLFVEGSHGLSLKKSAPISIISIYLLLFFVSIFFYFFGKQILGIIGADYISGYNLLMTMIFSSFFSTIYLIYISIKKVQKDMKNLLIISILNFIVIIALSYILLLLFGIIGIGYAWIIGYFFICLFILIREIHYLRHLKRLLMNFMTKLSNLLNGG